MKLMKRCYKKNPSLLFLTKIGEKTILLPMQENITVLEKIYVMNEVGAYIWELIDGKKTVEEIKKMIVKKFEVKSQVAKIDLISFLQKLEKRNYIKIRRRE